MRRVVSVLLLLPLAVGAQKLKLSEYDKLSKEWKIETFPIKIKSSPQIKMELSLRFSGNSLLLYLMGSGIGTNTVDLGSEAIFLLDNDSSVTIKSAAVQSFDYSQLVPAYKHEYLVSLKDLEVLSQHKLKSLRKYSAGGFDDVKLDNQHTNSLRELVTVFLAELKKTFVVPSGTPAKAPAFPGGNEVLKSFLTRNLKLPPELKNGDEKTVLIQFLVKSDGSVTDLQVKQSAGPSFDNESLRVLKRMPEWKPAVENGKDIDAVVMLPITFHRAGR